jgi:prepilin-type N-terminal cleavage/methylation domain-containing protein
MTHQRRTRRPGFTLAELLIAIALVAIVLGIAWKVRQYRRDGKREIETLAISADGTRLMAAYNNSSVQAWRLPDGKCVASISRHEPWSEIAFSPDGKTFAWCYYAGLPGKQEALEVRDMATDSVIREVPTGELSKMAISPDGQWLAITEVGSRKVRLVSINDADTPEEDFGKLVSSKLDRLGLTPQFSDDGRYVYYVDYNPLLGGNLSRWTVDSKVVKRKSLVTSLFWGNGIGPSAFTVSPDGNEIVIAGFEFADLEGRDAKPVLWRLRGDSLSYRESSNLAGNIDAPETWPNSVRYFEAGKSLAVLTDDLKILDAATLEVKRSIAMSRPGTVLAANSQGQQLVVADEDSIFLYDGDKLRKLIRYRPSLAGAYLLGVVFFVVIVSWGVIRWRRSRRAMIA